LPEKKTCKTIRIENAFYLELEALDAHKKILASADNAGCRLSQYSFHPALAMPRKVQPTIQMHCQS
jgi:hypothetical protein